MFISVQNGDIAARSIARPRHKLGRSKTQTSLCNRKSDQICLLRMLVLVSERPDLADLAQKLIEHFGALQRVIAASENELLSLDGIDARIAAQIKSHFHISIDLLRGSLTPRALLTTSKKLLSYLKASLAHSNVEIARLLLLDPRNGLICDMEIARGTTNAVAIFPAEIVRLAVMRRATALILVHNHPSGDPRPSAEDIEMTREIDLALRPLRIAMHDHIIIGDDETFSFARAGLLHR